MLSADDLCRQFGPRSGRPSVKPDLDPNCLSLWWYSWENFSKKLILKKKTADVTKAWKITQDAELIVSRMKRVNLFTNTKSPAKKIIWKFCLYLSSAANFCLHYLTKLSIETNSVDPDETAPIGPVWSESTLFVGKASKTFQQTTKADKFSCDWRFKG